MPLFQVWRDRRDEGWPRLLSYWGMPNFQVINRDVHVTKCAIEARDRRAVRSLLARDFELAACLSSNALGPLATTARAFKSSSSVVRSSSKGHKLDQVCAEASLITQIELRVGQCVASTTAPSILRPWCF